MTTTRAPYVTERSAVAGSTSTLSKSPQLFPSNAPTHLWQALGAKVWTTDGRVLTDWISGLMATTLGHNHPEVTQAVITHLGYGGPTWSLPHRLEEHVAETILRLTGFEGGQVRFFKTGSEACSAAVRIARAVTGRKTVITTGYHGWHDPLITTPPAWGVPSTASERHLAVGDHWSDEVSSEIAARFLEPVTTDVTSASVLEATKRMAHDHGALLIHDECITGGRYPEFTASQHYGVQPDLLVLSKGLANGWPLAAVVGPRDIMRAFDVDFYPDYADGSVKGPVYCSGTWATETSGLAACAATLAVWERDAVADRIWQTGLDLREALEDALAAANVSERVRIKGPAYRLLLDCPDLEDKTRIMARLLEKGHLVGTGWCPTAAHTAADIESCTEAFRYALERLDEPAGRCVQQPYRQA